MIILLLILSLFVADVAGAATYNVKTTGTSNCADATTATGVSTIIQAFTCVDSNGAGHIVEVYAGTYTQSLDSNLPGVTWPQGTAGNPFTLRARAGNVATIRATGEFNFRLFNSGNPNFYVVIDGFTSDGVNNSNSQLIFGDCCNVSAQQITVQNVHFINSNVSNTIQIAPKSTALTIQDNWFDSGAFGGYPIYNQGSGVTVTRNLFNDFPRYAIHNFCDAVATCIGGPFPSNNIYSFNTMRNFGSLNGGPGGSPDGREAAIILYQGSGNKIIGNLIYNGTAGIQVGNAASSTEVYNNTIYHTVGSAGSPNPNPSGESIKNEGTGSLIRNNIFSDAPVRINDASGGTFSNNFCSTATSAAACGFGTNNQTDSPANTFVSPGSDFRLKSGSLAINNGFNLSSLGAPYNLDITGAPRTVPYDIGAYEFGATTGPVVTITIPPNTGSVTVNSATISLGGTVQ